MEGIFATGNNAKMTFTQFSEYLISTIFFLNFNISFLNLPLKMLELTTPE